MSWLNANFSASSTLCAPTFSRPATRCRCSDLTKRSQGDVEPQTVATPSQASGITSTCERPSCDQLAKAPRTLLSSPEPAPLILEAYVDERGLVQVLSVTPTSEQDATNSGAEAPLLTPAGRGERTQLRLKVLRERQHELEGKGDGESLRGCVALARDDHSMRDRQYPGALLSGAMATTRTSARDAR